jgi:hypothetical protein
MKDSIPSPAQGSLEGFHAHSEDNAPVREGEGNYNLDHLEVYSYVERAGYRSSWEQRVENNRIG